MKKLRFRTVRLLTSAALILGATMTNTVSAAPSVATDPNLDPRREDDRYESDYQKTLAR
jgi:hypothetical protein